MIRESNTLALIPARGGSKGLPRKNVLPLGGKPLIGWTIESALASDYLDEVLVSTDDEEIAEVATSFGAGVQRRPADLARDHSLVIDTVRHTLAALQRTGKDFDLVVLLQPTSPLRPPRLIDDCLERLVAEGADSVATFSELGEPPERLWLIEEHIPRPLLPDSNAWLPRQKLNRAFYLNGLVYAFRSRVLLASPGDSLLFGRSRAMITEPGVDIDTRADLLEAERLLHEDRTRPRAE